VEAQVRAGDTVVVQGTGGVSLFALGFAKMLGARVVITSSSDEKLAQAKTLGADHLVNYRTTPDWEREVVKFTDGRGADLVVDVGGADTFARAIRATRMDGHVSVIGALSGQDKLEFSMAAAMARNVTIRGITVGSRTHFEGMCRALEVCRYRPVVHQVFDMEDASGAIELMKSQTHFGKIVLRAPT
jgi:NADPH:quinone reductase-like Zn-dependent oxidoreductase